MNQLIFGIILMIAGLICTTIGGLVANDGWAKFKKLKQPATNSVETQIKDSRTCWDVVFGEYAENGTWSPSVQYITSNANKEYAQVISVDEVKYKLLQKSVKISFDFLVDLKQVPSGSSLAIGGLPVVVTNGNVNNFKVYQTGLNHNGELIVSARRNTTWFDLVGVHVTDGSEDSVRFWGYIVYECGN